MSLTNICKMRKPLIWDLVKNSKRFQFLPANQVEHIEINMSVTQQGDDGIWKEKKGFLIQA